MHGTPKAAVNTQAISLLLFFLSICRLTPPQPIEFKKEKQPMKVIILCTIH